jgi:hydrophobe/amphiphile efflux-1 (HAE1) family protein
MRLSRFFIDRPIFACVLAVVIALMGALSIGALPISEYPEVVPPTIAIRATYPGASPETIAETVAAPIEQSVNGVEKMLYISSQSTADGVVTINVTFELGADLDQAQVLVQNRVATAEARLPEEVRRLGIVVQKSAPTFLMVVHVLSPDKTYDTTYVSNYASLHVTDQLARLPGVADVQMFGARDYSMRVWLDPEKIASRNLSPGDVLAALRRQNVQVAAGTLGAEPQPNGAQFELTVEAPGRLVDPEAFAEVVVATGAEGALVRLRDIGRVELGAQNYMMSASMDGKPAIAIGIFQRPGSNALQTAADVRKQMDQLQKTFPPGLKYDIVYDTTRFVSTSIHKVFETMIEAVALVVLVVFLFLQSWRAAVIPVLAIPVSILGVFGVLAVSGGSINTLSLFGLILAVGIVVDDAIVVVENVERNIAAGHTPKEAARLSMDEVGGALIAIALVLTAVFLPVGLIKGVAGEFYKQFALTITTATLISAFVSLTLSPALCAVLLKPHGASEHPRSPMARFFGAFNRGFEWVSERYGALTARAIRFAAIVLVLYLVLAAGAGGLYALAPKGFIPAMDRGYGFVVVQMPEGASAQRTLQVMDEVGRRVHSVKDIADDASFVGFSGITQTQSSSFGTAFFTYAPFEERGPGRTNDAILNDVRAAVAPVQEAMVIAMAPPAVTGLGSGAGVKLMIQDRQGKGYAALEKAMQAVQGEAMKNPAIGFPFSPYEAHTPRVKLEIDRDKAEALKLPVSEINDALQVYLGSAYVNDFNYLGRTYRVTAQADGAYRKDESDLSRLWARNTEGQMVPLSAVLRTDNAAGPSRVLRYNLFPAAEIMAEPAPGGSSGALIANLEQAAEKALPDGFGYEWTDIAYLQKTEGGGVGVFILAALFVFLVLAAQYESLTLPLAVILIVPMSVLGALVGVVLRGLDVNILTQVALLVLVGLAAKNAVLIVEFAKQLEDHEELSPRDAAIRSARLRLRPILMTSLAFILGVTPLVFATGAGAEQRIAIGTAVFTGMIGVTLTGLLLTPVFYVMTRRLSLWLHGLRNRHAATPEVA